MPNRENHNVGHGGRGGSCVDDDWGFELVTGGFTCADAVSRCNSTSEVSHDVERYCPRTCHACGLDNMTEKLASPDLSLNIDMFSITHPTL